MKCWFCGGKLIWSCDYSFEDYGIDDGKDGIVATLNCSNTECGAYFEGYLTTEDEEGNC